MDTYIKEQKKKFKEKGFNLDIEECFRGYVATVGQDYERANTVFDAIENLKLCSKYKNI